MLEPKTLGLEGRDKKKQKKHAMLAFVIGCVCIGCVCIGCVCDVQSGTSKRLVGY